MAKKGDRVKVVKADGERESFVGKTGTIKEIYGNTVWVKFGKLLDLQWFYTDEVKSI